MSDLVASIRTEVMPMLAHTLWLRDFKRVLTGVKKATYEEWLGDWKGKKPGTEDIVKLGWRNGTVIVVRTGLHPTGGKKGPSGRTLSIYYFLLQDFDPFVGRPEEQRYLARGFTSIDQHIRHAANQQRLYGESLRWDGIKSNLAYNRLCSAEMLRRFEVHYRFLSAFVHPVPAGFDLIYGRNRLSGAPRYDHYVSELILLYINRIAGAELKALKRMAGRPPDGSTRGLVLGGGSRPNGRCGRRTSMVSGGSPPSLRLC